MLPHVAQAAPVRTPGKRTDMSPRHADAARDFTATARIFALARGSVSKERRLAFEVSSPRVVDCSTVGLTSHGDLQGAALARDGANRASHNRGTHNRHTDGSQTESNQRNKGACHKGNTNRMYPVFPICRVELVAPGHHRRCRTVWQALQISLRRRILVR